MNVKSERVTILTTPDFKAFLGEQAKEIGVSVSEFVRIRCLNKPDLSEDEEVLKVLIQECRKSTQMANKSLEKGLSDISKTLKYLKSQRS